MKTDAREIIAQHLCEKTGQGWSGISTYERAAYRTSAHGMIEAITTAGYRIPGPDELDQVTVEKAAEAAYEAITDGEHAEEVSAAVRAIGRKA